MKKVSFSIFLLLNVLFFQGKLMAQKNYTEATLSYKISIEASGETDALAKSLEGATLNVYIKNMQSRSDMISALGTESNLFDAKTGKGVILKQYSGQKLMISLTKENWLQKNQFYQRMTFDIDNTEQTIAGISCKKATGKSADGNTFTVFFAPGIQLSNKQYENAFAQLPGLPVQYEVNSGKLKFQYTLSNISYDPVMASKFEIPKTGFRVMTYEENQQLKKGDK